MAIRFQCPSCQQPIEVDEPLGGQVVACPYCRHAVTAPSGSTWPPAEMPLASPASAGLAPPPPPPGHPLANHSATGSSRAPWALSLAIAGALLAIVGTFSWVAVQMKVVLDKTGPNPSDEQVRQVYQEMFAAGQLQPIPPEATIIFLTGVVCSIIALILAIRSLVRREPRQGMAIAACIISAAFSLCQIFPVLTALTMH